MYIKATLGEEDRINMELWDVYTKDRIKTGKTMVRGEAVPDGYYRLVIHVCIFNSRGQMLIQKRQPFKAKWSNLWDITLGGCAVAGENSQTAAARETKEEIGLDISFENIRPDFTMNFEHGFDDVYILERDIDINDLKLQYEEVQAVRWAYKEEIFKMIDDEIFIPYYKEFITMLFFMRNHKGERSEKDRVF